MRKLIGSRISLLVPLGLLLAALIGSATLYSVRTQQYSTWLPAQSGTVTQTENLREFNIRISYAYTVAGADYTGREVFHRDSSAGYPQPGDSAEIWYDPAHPERSSYGRPNALLCLFVPMFIAVPLSVAVYFALNNDRALYASERH